MNKSLANFESLVILAGEFNTKNEVKQNPHNSSNTNNQETTQTEKKKDSEKCDKNSGKHN